jgi:hypothetical protein
MVRYGRVVVNVVGYPLVTSFARLQETTSSILIVAVTRGVQLLRQTTAAIVHEPLYRQLNIESSSHADRRQDVLHPS